MKRLSPPAAEPPRLRGVILVMAAAAALVTAIGVERVAERQEIIQVGYRLTEATAELRRQREEHRRLTLEKSVLTDPERIERLARSLGMQRPSPEQIRIHPAPAELAEVTADP